MEGLGELLRNEKRYADSEKVLHELLETRRRTLGDDHPASAQTAYVLASVPAVEGKRQEAFSELKLAFDHQLSSSLRAAMAEDPAFRSLQGDARFAPFAASSQQAARSQNRPLPPGGGPK